MKLTIVGSAAAYTSRPGRASSCYLVEDAETALILDMGQGAFSELWRYGEPDRVAAVVISHLHADHCVDLIPLRHFLKFERQIRGPLLYGPPELRARFGDFQADPESFSDFAGGGLNEGSFIVGGLSIEARRVTHLPDSFAFRVTPTDQTGPGLVYSGDCGEWRDLVPLIREGDTLLSEAFFGSGSAVEAPHLNAAQAAQAATTGRAAGLVLTHIRDGLDESAAHTAAREVFTGDVQIAQPGMTLDIR